jgi:hypothetical protein
MVRNVVRNSHTGFTVTSSTTALEVSGRLRRPPRSLLRPHVYLSQTIPSRFSSGYRSHSRSAPLTYGPNSSFIACAQASNRRSTSDFGGAVITTTVTVVGRTVWAPWIQPSRTHPPPEVGRGNGWGRSLRCGLHSLLVRRRREPSQVARVWATWTTAIAIASPSRASRPVFNTFLNWSG